MQFNTFILYKYSRKEENIVNHSIVATMSLLSSTRFEWLSNEILLGIFEYLSAYHMYQAWYGLNARINALIQWVPSHIRYDGSMVDPIIWNAVTSCHQSSKIRMLSCFGDMKIDRRILINPMENLRTIVLNNMPLESIDEVCKFILPDNQIKCLSIQSRSRGWYNGHSQYIPRCLLVEHSIRFQSLTHLSLVYHYEDFPDTLIILPHLRYLSLVNVKFSHNLLRSMQMTMPSLRSLRFQGAHYSLTPSSMVVQHVHELSISAQAQRDISFLISTLSNFPSLRRLHIDSEYDRRYPILNGPIFQQLIEKYLPHLKQLTIDFNPGVDKEVLSTFRKGEFWLKKRVKGTKLIDPTDSRHSVISTIFFGKEWRFRYFDNLSLAKLLTC